MPKLNNAQLKQLADSTSNLGVVLFATIVTPIFASIDKINPYMILSGLVLMVVTFILSLLILKGVKR